MNYKLANLSLLCAILVVTIHIGPLRDGFGSGWWFRQLVGNGLASFAVSYFFCVSGFMLAKHTREAGWWSAALKKRFFTIFIPLLCAIGLNLALNAPMMCFGDLVAQRPFGASIWSLKDCFSDIFCLTIAPPYFIHLWFLRMLLFCVLLSGVCVWMVRRVPYLWFVALLALGQFFNDGYELFFNFGSLFWFSLGIYIREKNIAIKSSMLIGVLLVVGGVILILLRSILLRIGFDEASHLVLFQQPLLMLGFWMIMPERPFLGGYAFPIYILHWGLSLYPQLLLKYTVGDTYSATASVFKIVVTVILSVTLAMLMRKILPRVSAICFGGR